MKNPAHKLSKVLVAAAAVLFGVASAHADAYIINNYKWSFTVDSSGAATVTGAKTNPGGDEPRGVFKIPSSINGHTVKAIGSGAFASCCNVSALELPSTLETIGEGAFYECESITRLYVPASVTSIGYEAFAYCSSLKTVHLPRKAFLGKTDTSEIFRGSASGLDIRYYATAVSGGHTWHYEVVSRKGLYSAELARPVASAITGQDLAGPVVEGTLSSGAGIEVPYSLGGYNVTSIGERAFHGGNSIGSVTIPNSVTNIGDYAFYECSGLTSVTIPGSVTSIGDDAFYYCTSLDDVVIPDGVTSIGQYAFYYCSSLKTVAIPPSVTAIGIYAFKLSPLEEVRVAPGDSYRVGNFLKSAGSSVSGVDFVETCHVGRVYGLGDCKWYYTLKNGYAKLLGGEFGSHGAALAGNVTIPWSVGTMVTEIGDSAFTGLDLTSVVIPQTVKRIGDAAFYDCASLTSVAMPGVVTIGEMAFEDCVKLADVDLPDSLKTIGIEAFCGCPLKTLSLGANVASVGNMAFGYIDFESVTLESQAAVNSFESAFEHSTIASLTLGGSVKVGDNAFCKRSDLNSVTIGGSVQLGDFAFADCANLKSVTIGKDVSGAWEGGFKWCNSLTSVTLEPGLAAIGAEGFEFCESLTSIAIPSSVTSIGSDAFWGTGLTKVYVDAGDTSRVRAMLEESGFSTSGITFVDPAPAVYT
ncbi:MAG: leucine-rich repeat domain-containing protein, partial [Kiritimatiellae bacterium]|nr:leucine-rich repeat domain-containing protein [Kiritimatiellia bacterium]